MSVGQSLAAARADNGMTLEALSASTRIRATLIHAIEADDFSMCGGDVYARGHIRSIARVLGVDDAPLLAEFDVVHPRETIDQTVEAIGNDWRPVRTRERSKPAYGLAMATVVVLAIAAIVVAGLLKKPAASTAVQPIIGTSTTVASSVTPTASPTPSPVVSASVVTPVPSEASTDIAKAPVDGVNLRLRVTGNQCWVSVTDTSGKPPVQVTLHKGEVRDFRDPTELRVVIGNAGALTIIYNGKELPPLGKVGAVVHQTFTASVATASAG